VVEDLGRAMWVSVMLIWAKDYAGGLHSERKPRGGMWLVPQGDDRRSSAVTGFVGERAEREL
jgi:hypothetical protein